MTARRGPFSPWCWRTGQTRNVASCGVALLPVVSEGERTIPVWQLAWGTPCLNGRANYRDAVDRSGQENCAARDPDRTLPGTSGTASGARPPFAALRRERYAA